MLLFYVIVKQESGCLSLEKKSLNSSWMSSALILAVGEFTPLLNLVNEPLAHDSSTVQVRVKDAMLLIYDF